jgi:hypothetical protein
VSIAEEDVFNGKMEDLLIEGVTDILNRVAKKPRAVLVYTSCVHHFMGCDLPLCYRVLSGRFPDIRFTDCYMTPIMRKSWKPPITLLWERLYSLIDAPASRDEKTVTILGNELPEDPQSDAMQICVAAGWRTREIAGSKTWEDYQALGRSQLNIVHTPLAREAAKDLKERLKTDFLFLPQSFDAEELKEGLSCLAEAVGLSKEKLRQIERSLMGEANRGLDAARAAVGDTPVVIDNSITSRPLSLARLLLQKGFNVKRVYADSYGKAEKADLAWLNEHAPALECAPIMEPGVDIERKKDGPKTLALGQKAAFFAQTEFFVNVVEGNEEGLRAKGQGLSKETTGRESAA